MHQKITPILAIACLIFLSGCFKSKLPLSNPESSQTDSKIIGAWHGVVEGQDVYLHVIPIAKTWMRLVHVSHPKRGAPEVGGADMLEMFLTEAGDKKFMNVQFREPKQGESNTGKGAEYYYWFFKYDVSKEGVLTIWELDYEMLKQTIDDKKLKGKSWETTWDSNIYLDDTSESMLSYFKSDDSDKIFKIYGHFKKIQSN